MSLSKENLVSLQDAKELLDGTLSPLNFSPVKEKSLNRSAFRSMPGKFFALFGFFLFFCGGALVFFLFVFGTSLLFWFLGSPYYFGFWEVFILIFGKS